MGKRLTQDEVIARFRTVHGDKYDYSLVIYERYDKPVCIICPIHGIFWQTPEVHWSGHGCPACAIENREQNKPDTLEQFITDSEAVHGVGRYDYSLSNYKDAHTKLNIICHEKDENGEEHGVFPQMPYAHKNGQGCPKCGRERQMEKRRKTIERFIEDAEAVHGVGTYDYSLIKEYKNNKTELPIVCHKKYRNGLEHGVFLQRPDNHIGGKQGCPACAQSHMEEQTALLLTELKIKHIPQCDRKTFGWLGRQSLDFYLTDYNVAIECQGIQHFEPTDFHGDGEEYAEKKFRHMQKLDERKRRLCKENNVPLYYIRYDEDVKTALKKILEQLNY